MNIFGIQTERIYKIKSPLPITYFLCYLKSIFQSPFMSRLFLILHRDSIFLLIYLLWCLWIYSIIIPQFTWKYYVIKTPFHFRRRAEAVLRRAARLSKAFSTARPSTPKKWFYTSIWAVLYEKDLTGLSTARRLK